MGIVLNLARTIDEIVEEQHIEKVAAVVLEVGEVSGIRTPGIISNRGILTFRNRSSELKRFPPSLTAAVAGVSMKRSATGRSARTAEAVRPGWSKETNASSNRSKSSEKEGSGQRIRQSNGMCVHMPFYCAVLSKKS